MWICYSKNLCAVAVYNVLFHILLGLGCDNASNPKWSTMCINTVSLASEEEIGDPNHINHPLLLSENSLSFLSHSSYLIWLVPHSRMEARSSTSHTTVPPGLCFLRQGVHICVFWLINNQQCRNPTFLLLWLLVFSPLPNCSNHLSFQSILPSSSLKTFINTWTRSCMQG